MVGLAVPRGVGGSHSTRMRERNGAWKVEGGRSSGHFINVEAATPDSFPALFTPNLFLPLANYCSGTAIGNLQSTFATNTLAVNLTNTGGRWRVKRAENTGRLRLRNVLSATLHSGGQSISKGIFGAIQRRNLLNVSNATVVSQGVILFIGMIKVTTLQGWKDDWIGCTESRLRLSGHVFNAHLLASDVAAANLVIDAKLVQSAATKISSQKESVGQQSVLNTTRQQTSLDPNRSPSLQQRSQQFQFRFITYDSRTPSDRASPNSSSDVRSDRLFSRPDATSPTSEPQHQNLHEQTLDKSYSPYAFDSPRACSQDNTDALQIAIQNTILTEGECPNPPQAHRNDMSLDIAQSSGLELPLDPELFQPVDDLSMNWLPIDFSKDLDSLQPMDPDFSYDTAHEWWLESLNAKDEWLEPTTDMGHIAMLGLTEQSCSLPFTTTKSSQLLSSLSPDGSSLSASNDEKLGFGDHYVDGEGSRHTKQKRKRKTCWAPSENLISSFKVHVAGTVPQTKLAFPAIHEKLAHEICLNTSTVRQIPPSTYGTILNMFNKLCCAQTLFTPFESSEFPGADLLSYFLCHYLDEFQSVYPVFHMPTFDLNEAHWILILTISGIGSCLINSPDTARYAYPLQEFARRAILVEKETYKPASVPIWLIQAMLLNCIGLIYGGDDQAKSLGLSSLSDLVRFAHQEKLLSNIDPNINSSTTWKQWVELEMARRTGYLIWLLDSTLVYTETDFRPLFTLKDAQAPIPSHEILWDAGSEKAWEALNHEENLSLYSATEVLFIEKRLVSNIGEFGHTLLLHALYQRLWEVSDYFQSPLTCWNPNAARQSREAAIPSSDAVWLPGIPMYSKWRNSACDCLDTLHWFANGTIAKAAGLEHSTVLHLHTARIVLLVPFQEIRNLATSLADGTVPWDNGLERSPAWQHARRWVRHDQYKARLAIVHAGSVLWYVRRYSTNAFHEPIAVFLATLTLWAYGLCIYDPCGTQRKSPTADVELEGLQPQQRPSICEPDLAPTFIHLDRPCDDEIVQLFVREGQTMSGNVTGVGDICSLHGPSRILKEGIRILSSLASTWGGTHEYIDILSRLGDRVSLPMQE
ncbi:hypothetical protein UA08_08491 [Talaromyces atroroseus]|uniref:Xylanolytic transcriptional activator regulatory domain-containing protein n=1 Tax=Talaromyces atroroseus TaxID=1441469 RepID=A0A1Q5Q7Z6_TALAT|nr:hypothetical protein UA08_08491 [Talaromyces atroroseus]OKL56172.1 hypothetical protein UA08_08491 [Talaromyces atroroseus]